MSLERMSRLSLGMWDGIYFCRDKDCLITLQADFFQQQGRLYINGQPIKKFNFANGLLEWSVQEGIDDCGCLRLDIDRYGQRCLMGSFYQPNKTEPADFFKFPELRLLKNSLYPLVGCYRQLIATTSYQYLEIKPVSYSPNLRKIAVLLDKVLQEAPIRYDPFHKTLFVGKNAFPLAINGRNAEGWSPVAGLGSWYEGSYKLSIKNSASVFHHLEIHSQKATLNQQILMINKIGLKNLTWNKSNAFFPEGKLSFYLNPINLLPYGLGVVKPASGSACICYGIAAEAEQTFATVDYHGLFDISDAAWHRLTQQCNRETIAKQNSLVFWVSFYRVAQSIKMLYWLAKQMSV